MLRIMDNDNLIAQILSSSINQETILFRLVRYIEEAYKLGGDLNHWDSQVDELDERAQIFYRSWLWLSYLENEQTLLNPIPEASQVLGKEICAEIERCISLDDLHNKLLLKRLAIEDDGGKLLLAWAKGNVG